jgi:parvulin-like peptidyl-prolyl isomerase
VGKGATIADYQAYMTTYYEGFMYFQSKYEEMVPTREEMDAYFAEHAQEYAAQGITQDGITVDIRHILVLPEGATVETIYTETFPEEAWAVGQKEAEEILNQWLSGDQTEERFAQLAKEFSKDPGSSSNGGLYTDVATGQMVEAFDAWCFDPARKAGDYGIVKTELGFHIMYFSGSTSIWEAQVQSDLMGQRGSDLLFAMAEKYPMTADYSAISIGFVDMTA